MPWASTLAWILAGTGAVLTAFTKTFSLGKKRGHQVGAVLAIFALLVYFNLGGFAQGIDNAVGASSPLSIGGGANVPPAQAPSQAGNFGAAVNPCSSGLTTTLHPDIQDKNAASATFVSGSTVYAIQGTGTAGVQYTGTSSSSISQTNITVGCNIPTHVAAVTQAGVAGSAEADVTPTGSSYPLNMPTVQLAATQVRVKDLSTDVWQALYPNGNIAATNASTFTDLNDTRVYVDSTGEAANISIGANGFLHVLIPVQSKTALKSIGDKNLPVWACFDENAGGSSTATNWQAVPTASFNGVPLSKTDQKGLMHPDDLSGNLVANSEACIKMTDDGSSVQANAQNLDLYFSAKSGANPTTNDDIKVCILPEGRYLSNLVPNVIKQGVYTDASSPVLVTAATDHASPCFTLNIQ